MLENTVFLHINRNLGLSDRVFYFQDTAECDFVIQRNGQIDELIQVTWEMSDDHIRAREINGLLDASKATGCDRLTIVTVDEEATWERNGKTILVVPAWKWLLP